MNILVAAQDPGGAFALAPVLSQLSERGDIDISVFARMQASSIFDHAGLNFSDCTNLKLDIEGWTDFVVSTFERYQPDCVLTATSDVDSLERAVIRVARRRNTRSITLVDSWTNYANRFLVQGEGELSSDILPDMIAVIDQFSAAEMEQAGFPNNALHVVGQPAFDQFVSWLSSNEANDAKESVRSAFGVTGEQKLVVFISQPIGDMYPLDSDFYRGYTEFDAMRLLISSMLALEQRSVLAIKPHPKSHLWEYLELPAQYSLPIEISSEFDVDSLILAADLIVGMTSIVLVKGLLAKKRVLSFQPNLLVEDALVLSRMGIIRTLTDSEALTGKLSELLTDSTQVEEFLKIPNEWGDGNSVERIIALIDNVIDERHFQQ